jgi:hypothetical protein
MRPRFLPTLLLAACALLLAGCPGGSSPAEPPAAPGGGGPPAPVPEDVDAARRRVDEIRAAADREAHRLLDEFRARVHDPMRDDGLRRAEGRIGLELDGVAGEYTVAFDASRPDDRQVEVATVREGAGMHAGAAAQAKRFAVLALRGPYSQVLSYTPPVPWDVIRADDGRLLLVAPPFRGATGVTYRLDGTGLVEVSGAADGRTTTRTFFHWTPWKGRFLLARSVEDDGKATIGYEYGDEKAVALLRRATLTEGAHRCVASFTWTLVATE